MLLGHPSVARAVVVARSDGPDGGAVLVGYVVPAAGASVDAAAVRAYVGRSLPEYMVPLVVVLDALPLTPSGKVDRKALPAPDLGAVVSSRTPRDPVEEVLCALFAQILGLERVGIDDSFFELGGHSLLATRLVSRARSALGTSLSIRDVFEAPTVAALADRARSGERDRPPLTAVPRTGALPTSSAQRRLWFLNRLEGPESAAYNMRFAVRLSGPLDVAALGGALADVVGRHESLRTVFPEVDGEPRQVVLDAAEVWPGLDVVDLVDGDAAGEVSAARAARGFDLTAEIPLRAHLYRTAPDEHLLLLVVHHIAADGWSVAPLTHDVSRAYAARCGGGAPEWSALPVQYADFAVWQRDLLGEESDASSVVARQLAYWRELLSGAPEELALPFDRARPAVMSHRGGTVPFRLDAGAHGALVRLARESGASVFMVLQAGLAALLSRLGAGEDVPIGSPVAGRLDDALDELVGCFMNTLVLRTDVSGDPAFRDLLDRARDTALGAFENQDVPFERLVEVLDPERSMGRNPLFQVMLSLQNNEHTDLHLPGLTVAPEPVGADTAKFDLSLTLMERQDGDGAPDGLEGFLEFSADVFDESTAASVAARLARLLEQVADDPDLPVSGIELLTAEERHRILTEWNDTAHPLPPVTLPEAFQRQAARSPEAVAVVSGGTELSYGELNGRANRLARQLIARGAGPERLVALALPRTEAMVVALLAVLKSGAAYLPVDPAHPAERIELVLGDARPALLVTDTATAGRLPDTGVPRLVLDDPGTAAAVAAHDAADLDDAGRAAPLDPAHTAYVLYTSGSTGRPKGVAIEHRNLMNFLLSMAERFPMDARDRLLAVTTWSFDIAGLEVYVPLLSGAGVVVGEDGVVLDPEALTALIERAGVTVMQATPALWQELVAREPEAVRGLRVLVGGEAVPATLAETLTAHAAEVTNLYGPTETTIWSTATRLVADEPVTLGRPIRNTGVFVLDGGLRPVPVGVAGELYLSGAGVARGY
ncbi:condensation domain-containing protein, partial [Streptomyces sp. NPDC002773]|uniref:condensation domain-containing protein n=1 Tax=Streptomyces sp. NPDC002773 TaxID=3154430 RepID=UPI00332099C7